jgi:hypothetical protein
MPPLGHCDTGPLSTILLPRQNRHFSFIKGWSQILHLSVKKDESIFHNSKMGGSCHLDISPFLCVHKKCPFRSGPPTGLVACGHLLHLLTLHAIRLWVKAATKSIDWKKNIWKHREFFRSNRALAQWTKLLKFNFCYSKISKTPNGQPSFDRPSNKAREGCKRKTIQGFFLVQDHSSQLK